MKDLDKLKQSVEEMKASIKNMEAEIKVMEKPEETYRIGDRFLVLKDEYILAAISDYEVVAINLKSGCRKNAGVVVKSCMDITENDLKQLLTGYYVCSYRKSV